MSRKKMIRYAKNLLIYFSGLIVVLFVMLHLATPILNMHPDWLKTFINRYAQNIQYQKVKIHWRAFGPTLEFDNINFIDKSVQQSLFHADHAQLVFDVFRNLKNLDGSPKRIKLQGVSIFWKPDLAKKVQLKDYFFLDDKTVELKDASIEMLVKNKEDHEKKIRFIMSNGSLRFAVTDNHLSIRFENRHFRFIDKELFAEPFFIRILDGAFSLSQTEKGLECKILWFELKQRNLTLSGKGRILQTDDQSSYVDLEAYFSAMQFHQLLSYLPVNRMPARSLQWFKQANIQAEDLSGRIELHGPLHSFPFDDHSGWFTGNIFLKNGSLHYGRNWPTAEKITGNLFFHNRSFQMEVNSAEINQTPIQQTKIWMPRISSDASIDWLFIQGQAKSDTQNGLAFVHESPLEKNIGKGLHILQAQGAMKLVLAMQVPIAQKSLPVTTQGTIYLENNWIRLPDWHVELKQVNGPLFFTEKSFSADDVRGELLNQPFLLTAKTIKNVTQINLKSHNSISQFATHWQFNPKSYVEGEFDYEVNIHLPHQAQQKHEVKIVSDGKGIQLNLPKPYEKKPEQILPITISVDNHTLIAQLKNWLTALVEVDPKVVSKLHSGVIVLGSSAPKHNYAKNSGWLITGEMPYLDFDRWRKFLLLDGSKKQQPETPVKIDMNVKTLDFYDRKFSDIHLGMKKNSSHYFFDLAGNQIDGKIVVSTSNPKKINANLKRLILPPSTHPEKKSNWKPNETPALNLSIEQFAFSNIKLGQLKLSTHLIKNYLSIDELILLSDQFTLNAAGNWNSARTALQGGFYTRNLAQTLKKFNLPPAIHSKYTQVNFNFIWAGSPFDFALKNLNGALHLNLQDGRIEQLDPQTEAKLGIGRLLSVLSLQTLPKILTLDIGNLLEPGFTFDTLKGRFVLSKGDAYTKDAELTGSIVEAAIRGRIGLAKKDYDLVLIIKPMFANSLPLAGTIAGGPIGGLAGITAWMVAKQISGYTYVMKGPWQKPELQTQIIRKK